MLQGSSLRCPGLDREGAGFLPAHLCSPTVTTAPFAALGRTCTQYWHPSKQPQGALEGESPL